MFPVVVVAERPTGRCVASVGSDRCCQPSTQFSVRCSLHQAAFLLQAECWLVTEEERVRYAQDQMARLAGFAFIAGQD